ncbi:FecR family protein [Runella zeae]|uniref:FecR family protein n=1 Tax=Runella zeae TaxID=94255 RepID=UPI0003FFA026|nr:FecR family protein [Runella zeae]
MSKKHFHKLLSRYRQGECSEQERRLVDQWFTLIDGEKPNHTYEDSQQIENQIWKAIKSRQNIEPTFSSHQPSVFSLWRWIAAASVLLGLVWGGYQWQKLDRTLLPSVVVNQTKGLKKETNTSQQPQKLTLVDGTEISLQPNASIEFPERFEGTKREVFLTGKAFFKVKRNSQKPFFVYTGEVVTKVLGTSFWVNAPQDNRSVEVAVLTGKVSVFQRDARNDYISEKVKSGVILTPNQKVFYTQNNQTFVTSLVENPVLIPSETPNKVMEPSFIFDDTPLSEVMAKLEESYGIEFILENERLRNCLFTADITKQPLFTKLDLLCASINASYEVRGTKILVSGNGCAQE